MFQETKEHIAVRWRECDKPFLQQLFPLLACGKPISLNSLALITGKSIPVIEHELLKGHVERDTQGNAVELFGISLVPTRHRIQVGQVCLFSCCALVAHMVPLLLEQTAISESVDPVRNELVRIRVSPTGVQSVDPESSVGTLVITKQNGVLENVRTAFCIHVCHFPNAESAYEFIALDERRYVVSIEQLYNAARQLKAAIW